MKITNEKKNMLIHAWNYCDAEDKSTEFTLQYMADLAGVTYEDASNFMFNYERTDKDFEL